jgi:hypothetical protein
MTNKNNNEAGKGSEDLIQDVIRLADEVKMTAMNLAINLARSKEQIQELSVLEPKFTELINGSIDVIKEVATIMKAFSSQERTALLPDCESSRLDRVENYLNHVLALSRDVLDAISRIKKARGNVDKYRRIS